MDTATRLQRELQLGQTGGNGSRRGAVAARLSDVGRGGEDRDRPEVVFSLHATCDFFEGSSKKQNHKKQDAKEMRSKNSARCFC